MRTISSRSNPLIRQFRDVADAADPESPLVLLDGVHLVTTALDARLPISLAAIADAERNDPEFVALIARLEAAGTEVVEVSSTLMDAMSPVRSPSGVVALAERVLSSPHALLRAPMALVLAAADVQDPGNLGALVRSAEAASATGVIASGLSATPLSWKALRGSMGSALRLPVAIAVDTFELLGEARAAHLQTVAAVPRGGQAPEAIDWTRPTLLLLGGEGPGLSRAVVEASDACVTIAMADPVESLNVSVAGALLLYAARRQRAVSR